MKLTVLSVSFPLARVGPDAPGGAEQVLWQLDRALVLAGHRSLVLAPEGSRVAGELVPVPLQPAPLDVPAWHRAHEAHRARLRAVLGRERVDLVHLHGVDFHAYLPPPGPAALATLHLPASFYPEYALRPSRPRTWLHCVSAAQRALFPPDVPLLDDVPNGVDLEAFRPAAPKGSFALVLGRVCADKGVHLALEAARRARVPLLVAGVVQPFPEHLRYFEREVRPRLDRMRRFLGPVGGARKQSLLARARCLVVASQVPETTSLVALEALASGTPVVALRRGALADVVEHGRTGWLVDRPEELGEAIRAAPALDAATCRRAAEERFSLRATLRRYLSLYERLASTGDAGAPGPRAELRLEEVTDAARLEAVGGPWQEFWARSPGATPFSTPAWLLAFCRHLAAGPPHALLAWRGRELAAVLPSFVYADRGARVLGLLGGGVSDYQDALAEDGAAAAAVLGWIATRRGAFDRALLQALPAWSPLLAASPPAELAAAREVEKVCPVVPLPPRLDDLGGGRVPGVLRDARQQLRRMEREGGARFAQADAGTWPELLEELFRLHRARWTARGQGGVLGPRERRFHLEAAPGLLAAGALRLLALRFGGRTIAVVYGLLAHRRAAVYLTGIDPAARHRSPGSVLLAHALQQAIAEGARELDFLRGREPHKYRWDARDRPTFRLALTPRAEARAPRATPAPGAPPPPA